MTRRPVTISDLLLYELEQWEREHETMADTTNAATGGQASEPLSAARLAEIRELIADANFNIDHNLQAPVDVLRYTRDLTALLYGYDRLRAALAAAEAERAQWRESMRQLLEIAELAQYYAPGELGEFPDRVAGSIEQARALLAATPAQPDATTASCEFCGSTAAVKAHDMGGDRIMRLCRGCRQLIADGGVVE